MVSELVGSFPFRSNPEESKSSGSDGSRRRKCENLKFDGAYFSFWKMQTEDYLYQKDMHEPLTGTKPVAMEDSVWTLLDRKALGVIRLTLSRNVTFNIAKEKTMTDLMKAFSSMYEKSSASNKVHLMRRLFNLRMTEGASMTQHLNKLNTTTTQLSSVGIDFDEKVQALILLSSLPESCNATVTVVSSSSGSNKLKFNDVRDLVLSKEIRLRESGESSTSSVLHTKSRGRSSTRRSKRGKSKVILSSVGIAGRPDTTQISAGVHRRIRRHKMRQTLLQPHEEVMH